MLRSTASLVLVLILVAAGSAASTMGDLHTAARAGDADAVAMLMRAGVEIDETDADGYTALLAAAHEGHIDVVRLLLAGGADLEATLPDGRDIETLAKDPEVKALLTAVAKADYERTRPIYVKVETSMGEFTLELNREKAPISVANFIAYAEEGYYDGTIFHRVIGTFMVQGGGFTADMTKKQTGAGIKNEWQNGLLNTNGTVAMARLGNQPDSATSQFFINVADNAFLDQPRDGAGYAVFGKVVEGMDVVNEIKGVPTGVTGQMRDVPKEPVIITSVSVVEG